MGKLTARSISVDVEFRPVQGRLLLNLAPPGASLSSINQAVSRNENLTTLHQLTFATRHTLPLEKGKGKRRQPQGWGFSNATTPWSLSSLSTCNKAVSQHYNMTTITTFQLPNVCLVRTLPLSRGGVAASAAGMGFSLHTSLQRFVNALLALQSYDYCVAGAQAPEPRFLILFTNHDSQIINDYLLIGVNDND
jgi:hypothetical protein